MAYGRIAPGVIREVATSIFSASYKPGLYHIYDIGSTWYFGLLTERPELSGTLFAVTGEVSYSGYARQSVGRNLTAILGTHQGTGASTGTSGTITNASNIYFPLCSTSDAVVTHVAMIGQYGQAYAYWELDQAVHLSNSAPGFFPCLPARSLAIRLDD